MRCPTCGDSGQLYDCPKCEVRFCVDHRLPDEHGCPALFADELPDPPGPKAKIEWGTLQAIADDGWFYYAEPAQWILENARGDEIDDVAPGEYKSKVYRGDTYVYKVVGLHTTGLHVFSRIKW